MGSLIRKWICKLEGTVDLPSPEESFSILAANLLYEIEGMDERESGAFVVFAGEKRAAARVALGIAQVVAQTGCRVRIGGGNMLEEIREVQPGIFLPCRPESISGLFYESVQFKETLAQCRRDFDYTFLVTPPAGLSAQGICAAKLADGAVIVVELEQTPHPEIEKSLELFQGVNAKVLGFAAVRRSGCRR